MTLAHRADIDAPSFAALAAIARSYRADLVPLAMLEQAAAEHGAALADHVRPAPTPAPAPTPHFEELRPPAAVGPAPDARPEDLGRPIPMGFDGRPLKHSGLGFSGGSVGGY